MEKIRTKTKKREKKGDALRRLCKRGTQLKGIHITSGIKRRLCVHHKRSNPCLARPYNMWKTPLYTNKNRSITRHKLDVKQYTTKQSPKIKTPKKNT